MVAHTTFCIVVVFNNVIARIRRLGENAEAASLDLGATRVMTFRLVTFPALRSALLAGGLLAFALSFDEIIVTTFTAGAGTETLPIWILNNLTRPNNAPVVNVIGTVLILFSILPIYLSPEAVRRPHRRPALTDRTGHGCPAPRYGYRRARRSLHRRCVVTNPS